MRMQDWHTALDRDKEAQLASVYEFARTNAHSALYHHLPKLPENNWLSVFLEHVPTLPYQSFVHTDVVLAHCPERDVRFLSSAFDPKDIDGLFLMPQRVDATWRSVDETLKRSPRRIVTMTLPLFWQLGPMLHHTCRVHGVPPAVFSPRNLPLMRQVVREVEADVVVATPEAARELFELLAQEGAQSQIKAWHLVVPVGSQAEIPQLPGEVLVEYHLFPGFPIGSIDAGNYREGFVPSPDYFFEIEAGVCRVTSLNKEAFPLVRFIVPGRAEVRAAEGTEVLRIVGES